MTNNEISSLMQEHFGSRVSRPRLLARLISNASKVIYRDDIMYYYTGRYYAEVSDEEAYILNAFIWLKWPENLIDAKLVANVLIELRLLGRLNNMKMDKMI